MNEKKHYDHSMHDVIPACGFTHDEILSLTEPIIDRIAEDIVKIGAHQHSLYIEQIEKLNLDSRRSLVIAWILSRTIENLSAKRQMEKTIKLIERVVMLIVAIILLVIAFKL